MPVLTLPVLTLPVLTLPVLTLPVLTLPVLTLPVLTLPVLTLLVLTLLVLTLKCHGKIRPTKVGRHDRTRDSDFSRNVPCHDTSYESRRNTRDHPGTDGRRPLSSLSLAARGHIALVSGSRYMQYTHHG